MTKVKFDIASQVPSKKNNKRILKNSRTGKMFIASSEKFNEWHNQAMMDLCFRLNKDRGIFRDKQVEIELTFYNSDNRRHDLDNMTSSVLDLLVDAEFIDDDCCRVVSKVTVIAGGMTEERHTTYLFGLFVIPRTRKVTKVLVEMKDGENTERFLRKPSECFKVIDGGNSDA